MFKFKAIATSGRKFKDGTGRIELTVKLTSNYSTEEFKVIQFPNTSIKDTVEEFVDYLYDLYDTTVNFRDRIQSYEEWCYERCNNTKDLDSMVAYAEELSNLAKYCKVMGKEVCF